MLNAISADSKNILPRAEFCNMKVANTGRHMLQPYSPQTKNKARSKRNPFLATEQIDMWNAELVVTAITKLNNEAPLKSLRSMRVNRRPVPDPIITSVVGRPTSRKFLHYAGCHFFGSWNSTLRKCNIEPITTSYNKFWSKTVIVESIKRLKEEGYPLTVMSIWRDRSKKTTKILLDVSGKATTGSSLHDAARRYYGSWDNALEKSGINPDSVKEKPFWTKKKIIRSIKILHKSGIPLNSERLGSDCGRATASIIAQGAGKKRFGRSLHGGAYRLFGSWDRALHEAGIDPALHRKRNFIWNTRQIG